jgi:hypothetical protein
MFRIMKKDADEKPKLGESSVTLGIRPGEIDLDANGNVLPNDKGISVNPAQLVPLDRYKADLKATRSEWEVDET